MFTILRIMAGLAIVLFPMQVLAGGPALQVVKRPEGLHMKSPDPDNPFFSAKDRELWKSVLNWCDECEERATPNVQYDNGTNGYIFIYDLGGQHYIVDVYCYMSMRQSEHLYYKVTVTDDTVESRLLELEQYEFWEEQDDYVLGTEQPEKALGGEFVRFTDSLAYGLTRDPHPNTKELILYREYRAMGGCGLYTVYDVSTYEAKVKEFRSRIVCTEEFPPFEQWTPHPAAERAKWRRVVNPLRLDWKDRPGRMVQKRCGWLDNRFNGNAYLYDRDGMWTICRSGEFCVNDNWQWPEFPPDRKVVLDGGSMSMYGCVCFDAVMDERLYRFHEIKDMRILPLDVCRQDPGLKRWRPDLK